MSDSESIVNTRPKRGLIAYCALADRLRSPGVTIIEALIPFIAEACQSFAGQMFDAAKFSAAVNKQFGLHIPRLAALALTEKLHAEGILEIASRGSTGVAYRYSRRDTINGDQASPVTESQIEHVLNEFACFCSGDELLSGLSRDALDEAFFTRLLCVDAMRILSRREAIAATTKSERTLSLPTASEDTAQSARIELRLDYKVSEFLLKLQFANAGAFDIVSSVAFANMAAETIAFFNEPEQTPAGLDKLTVFLDAPILLDILKVNVEYAEYGAELLDMLLATGARPSAFDHSITEAENVIAANLHRANSPGYSGLGQSDPERLRVLAGNVADRMAKRFGLSVHADPSLTPLIRRAQTTVGNIESMMEGRMAAWRSGDAKNHDRDSIWALLALRDKTSIVSRIHEAGFIFVTRNAALVEIANAAWQTWLKEATNHSRRQIERSAPIALTDKQLAAYLWLRSGSSATKIPKARLLANCSAAVRPRQDVRARAYSLILQYHGKGEADDFAVLLEQRDVFSALMNKTCGDPLDVTPERLPHILEAVKIAAGEFAAAVVRKEAAEELAAAKQQYQTVIEAERSKRTEDARENQEKLQVVQTALHQAQLDLQSMGSRVAYLTEYAKDRESEIARRRHGSLERFFKRGTRTYRRIRWEIVILLSLLPLLGGSPIVDSTLAQLISVLAAFGLAWFIPDFIDSWLQRHVLRTIQSQWQLLYPDDEFPTAVPDFKLGTWCVLDTIKSTSDPEKLPIRLI